MPTWIADDGVSIHYDLHGAGAEPLVLLHGMGSSGTMWNVILPHLELLRFRVLTLDFRGHGRSTGAPESFSFERYSRDVVGAMKSAGIVKATVVGFSGGCKNGAWLAAEAPHLVARVILVAPPGLGIVPMPRDVMWPFFEQLTRDKSPPPVLEPWLTEKLGAHRATVIQDYANTPLPVLHHAAEMWFYTSIEEQAARLTQPLLVVAGSREPLGNAAFQQQTTLKSCAHGKLEMLDCGHWIPFEEPSALARIISEFAQGGAIAD